MDLEQLTIRRVKKKELCSFFSSDFYAHLKHIPFTELRLKSYQNNPNSDPEDYILYFIVHNNQIISYRTLLFDKMFDDSKIIWSSGSWTNIRYRKMGLSKKLFMEVEKDYPQQSFIYTRSLASKKLYDSLPYFHPIVDLESKELHYDFSILKKKIHSKYVDRINKILPKNKAELQNCIEFKNLKSTEVSINSFLKLNTTDELFPLSEKKLHWILNFPWLSKDEIILNEQVYDFSINDASFLCDCFFSIRNNQLNSLFIRNIRGNTFFLHYVYYTTENEAEEIAKFIVNEMNTNNLKLLIVRDQLIQKFIKKYKKPLFIKPYKNFLFVPTHLKSITESKLIQHGIGELIFT
ncbi:MAG: hypothetical protein KBS93_05720 [Flavobacteriaceae bacterium]|nr:hypothetical protein [Candidatus Onthonaster equi]